MSSFEVIQNGNTFSVVERFVSGRKDELIFSNLTHDEALEFASDCTATLPTIEHQIEYLNRRECQCSTLNDQADLIDNRDDRWAVMDIIESARINACDTLNDNRTSLEDELKFHKCDTVGEYWDAMFLSTLESILACDKPSEFASAWFEAKGIKG